jgi:hypothetical protein
MSSLTPMLSQHAFAVWKFSHKYDANNALALRAVGGNLVWRSMPNTNSYRLVRPDGSTQTIAPGISKIAAGAPGTYTLTAYDSFNFQLARDSVTVA